jgi:hypothetical protein
VDGIVAQTASECLAPRDHEMLLIEQVSKGYLVLHIGTMPPAADSLRAELPEAQMDPGIDLILPDGSRDPSGG